MKIQLDEKWVECIDKIKDFVSVNEYDTWFACIKPVSFENNTLCLQVPALSVGEKIEKDYVGVMSTVIGDVFGKTVGVAYKIRRQKNTSAQKESTDKTKASISSNAQVVFDSKLCSKYSMESFIEGESNRLARSVAQTVAKDPGKTAFNPMFIYGPSGCGKTHLVNAIGLEIQKQHPELRVLYISAYLFYVQFANATKQKMQPEFINFYQTVDVLILDDIHEFGGKGATQNTFFHIFNHLHQNGKQLILTADRQPGEIEGLEERLLTRFKWGIPTEIGQPDKALRRAVLTHKVKAQKLQIPEAVITYIADTVNESIRDLEGILNSIAAYSHIYNIPINMKLVDMILPKFVTVNRAPISINDVKRIVCKYYHINETELCSNTRRQPISQIRQIAMYFASKLTNASTVQIGEHLGGRTHPTVIHSIKQIKGLIETSRVVRQDIEQLEEEITHRK